MGAGVSLEDLETDPVHGVFVKMAIATWKTETAPTRRFRPYLLNAVLTNNLKENAHVRRYRGSWKGETYSGAYGLHKATSMDHHHDAVFLFEKGTSRLISTTFFPMSEDGTATTEQRLFILIDSLLDGDKTNLLSFDKLADLIQHCKDADAIASYSSNWMSSGGSIAKFL